MNLGSLKRKPAVVIGLVVLVVVAFWVGRMGSRGGGESALHGHEPPAAQDRKPAVYTCPMHPQVRQGEPGRCPICGMELVAVSGDDQEDDSGGAPRLRVSPRAAALMDIQTWPVEHRHVEAERRFLGKFAYDETRLFDIVTRTDGQIERLFVNYTGVPVRQGEHLVEFYSPEFFAATQELLLAPSASTDATLLESTRTKLRLLAVSEKEIEEILRGGQPRKTFTLFSPVSGVIKELDGRQGVWRMKGERLLQLADLSTVWVFLDAYESDLPLIHYGQQVKLEVAAFPGREFTGFVAFIAPELDERTRTVKVRLNVPNPDGALRPGMFARAVLHVPLNAEGRAYGPELAGKWICPMHPEFVADAATACNICGMPLEPAEKLGHVRAEEEVAYPLVIPASAPLLTGKRAVVYVKVPDTDRPTFEGREVALGARAGNFYIVRSGLAAGELVVTEGNFKIDSELQLRGLPSMMAPEGGAAPTHQHGEAGRARPPGAPPSTPLAVPDAFSQQVAGWVQGYLQLGTSLAADDFAAARQAAKTLDEQLRRLDDFKLDTAAGSAWQPVSRKLHGVMRAMAAANDIATLRGHFEPLSAHTEQAVVMFGAGQAGTLYRVHCPMAFDDRGANWLQADRQIANPYFGASMLRCGEIKAEVK